MRTLIGALSGFTPPEDNIFTFVQVPDTQDASRNCGSLFENWIEYIADQKEARNIQMVMSPGDVVEGDGGHPNTYTQGQFSRAKTAYDQLVSAGVSFSLSPANHDLDSATDPSRDTTSWDATFPLSYFSSQPGYGGSYNSESHNMYFLKTLGGKQFMFLIMEMCPRDAVITWASNAISSVDPDYVILGTHIWLNPVGERDDGTNKAGSGGGPCYHYFDGPGATCNSGDEVYAALHAVYPSKMILTIGQHHTRGQPTELPTGAMASWRVDVESGYNINQAACNFQSGGCNDQAFLRFYEINVAAGTIEATTYNPSTTESLTNSDNEFSFTFQ